MVRHRKSDGDPEAKRLQLEDEVVRKLPSVMSRKEKVNDALEALQGYIEKGGSVLNGKNKAKMLTLHQNVLKACEIEADNIRKILADIETIRKLEFAGRKKTNLNRQTLMQLINLQGTSLPLYVGGVDGFPPPFVGAIEIPESTPLKAGDAAAAFDGHNWILAEIKAALSTGRYEIMDIDADGDDEQRVRLTVARKNLIPLPKWRADPKRDGHALFPPEAIVLALYPQTTCFYKGVVQASPQKAPDDYMVMFEDQSYPSGFSPALPIPQRYVVPHKEVKVRRRKGDPASDSE